MKKKYLNFIICIILLGGMTACGESSNQGLSKIGELRIDSIYPNVLTQGIKTKITVEGMFPSNVRLRLQDGVCDAPIEQVSGKFSQLCVVQKVGLKKLVLQDDNKSYLEESNIFISVNNAVAVTGLLNDTGIIQCNSFNNWFKDCAFLEKDLFDLKQDAEQGRDALAVLGQLSKIGAGEAAFDFTKIDADGQKLAATAQKWSCILDNHTGLLWEVKTDDKGLQDKYHRYQWYSSNINTNGGNEGKLIECAFNAVPQRPTESCNNSLQNCNTENFVNAINAKRLCGYQNWRLPSRSELLSIVNYGVIRYGQGFHDSTVDKAYFPNMIESAYWTSSTVAKSKEFAWYVDFSNGSIDLSHKSCSTYSVVLVNSGL